MKQDFYAHCVQMQLLSTPPRPISTAYGPKSSATGFQWLWSARGTSEPTCRSTLSLETAPSMEVRLIRIGGETSVAAFRDRGFFFTSFVCESGYCFFWCLLALQLNSYCGWTSKERIANYKNKWESMDVIDDTVWILTEWGPETHLHLPLGCHPVT